MTMCSALFIVINRAEKITIVVTHYRRCRQEINNKNKYLVSCYSALWRKIQIENEKQLCGSGTETKVNFNFKQSGQGRPHWEGDIGYLSER